VNSDSRPIERIVALDYTLFESGEFIHCTVDKLNKVLHTYCGRGIVCFIFCIECYIFLICLVLRLVITNDTYHDTIMTRVFWPWQSQHCDFRSNNM